MRPVAERVPEEFTGPVDYPDWLALLVVLPPLLVLAYYVGVWWWSRRGSQSPRPPRMDDVRREHLVRLDRVEAAVAGEELTLRAAHQSISEIVRSYAAQVGPTDTRVMVLEQLRHAEVGPVGDVVALVYPPEFRPGDEGEPAARVAPALRDARTVISTWRP